MSEKTRIICVIGPTASGKTARAIALAKERNGEVISVDSRQVYRTLDIGTEKISIEEMQGVPHHLIDIREPEETYSAGDFKDDAERLIADITARGKVPILAGGTHFYFDALLYGLPEQTPINPSLRASFEEMPNEELISKIEEKDARRAKELDPHNRHRLVRALEIIMTLGKVPERSRTDLRFDVEWHIINPPMEELRERITARLTETLSRGLIEEVKQVRERVGDTRLNEFGLEYRVVAEFLRGERDEASLLPALSAKLFQYAKRQKAWIRKLNLEPNTP
jgi:tRNA dimethylallyltransferase